MDTKGRLTGETWVDREGRKFIVGFTYSPRQTVYSVTYTENGTPCRCVMRAVDIQKAINRRKECPEAAILLDGPTSGTWQEIVMADYAALNGEAADGER